MKRRAALGILFFLSILSLCVGQAMAAGPTDVQGNPIHTKGKFGFDVVVGLRPDGPSAAKAKAAGFTVLSTAEPASQGINRNLL